MGGCDCAWSGILDLSSFEETVFVSYHWRKMSLRRTYEIRFSMEDSSGAALSDFKKTLRFGA